MEERKTSTMPAALWRRLRNGFYLLFRRHYCHKCGSKLKTVNAAELANMLPWEPKPPPIGIGRVCYMGGETYYDGIFFSREKVLFRAGLRCPQCKLTIFPEEQRRRDRQKKDGNTTNVSSHSILSQPKKKKTKKWMGIVLITILSILALILTCYAYLLVFAEPQEWMPQEGAWYCEELQMQITFVEGHECFAIIDGTKIPCQAYWDKGSLIFGIDVDTWDYEDTLPIGTVVFEGQRIELTEEEFIVLDRKKDKEVVFVRVE